MGVSHQGIDLLPFWKRQFLDFILNCFVNTLCQLIFSNLRPPRTSQPQLVTCCRDVRGKHSQHSQDERCFRMVTNDPGADLGIEHRHAYSENYKWQSHGAEKDYIPKSITFV